MASTAFDRAVAEQRRAWDARPLVRSIYADYFRRIRSELAPVSGPIVELGAGSGGFKEHHPHAIATDVAPTPWTDRVVDAQAMPFAEASVGNLVALDVLHHLPRPAQCLREAERVLVPGGRMVLIEPYCGPVSTLVYRHLHHEPVDFGVDPFADGSFSSDDPWDANEALPTILFFREADRLPELVPALRLVKRVRFSWLLYSLSGGFSKPALVPHALRRPVAALERLLRPLDPLLALRCLVVLEKRG